MASLNKVILIGRLGKDPEVTSFENGNKKISVTMATSERYRDRDQNWVEQTDWHNIVVWGNLRTRQYTDQQGAVRYVTEVIADKMMQLAPARPAQQSSYGQPYTPATEPAPTGYTPQGNFDAPDEGNDLPF